MQQLLDDLNKYVVMWDNLLYFLSIYSLLNQLI
jgi:hypothetical protein